MAQTMQQAAKATKSTPPPMPSEDKDKGNGEAKPERAARGSKQTYLLVVTGEDGMYAKAGEGKEHTKGIVDDLLVRGYKACETMAKFHAADRDGKSVFFCVAGAIKTPVLPQPQLIGL